MAAKSYKTLDFAVAQLETALRLYFEGADYFSIITLAGAAEEILGRLAEARGKEHSLSQFVSVYRDIYKIFEGKELSIGRAIHDANYAKNIAKHVDPDKVPAIFIDLKDEAEGLLDRAIDNYFYATENMSDAMQRYQDSRRDV